MREEYTALTAKIERLQERADDLQRKITETENAEIIETVRASSFTADELRLFMAALKNEGVKMPENDEESSTGDSE